MINIADIRKYLWFHGWARTSQFMTKPHVPSAEFPMWLSSSIEESLSYTTENIGKKTKYNPGILVATLSSKCKPFSFLNKSDVKKLLLPKCMENFLISTTIDDYQFEDFGMYEIMNKFGAFEIFEKIIIQKQQPHQIKFDILPECDIEVEDIADIALWLKNNNVSYDDVKKANALSSDKSCLHNLMYKKLFIDKMTAMGFNALLEKESSINICIFSPDALSKIFKTTFLGKSNVEDIFYTFNKFNYVDIKKGIGLLLALTAKII